MVAHVSDVVEKTVKDKISEARARGVRVYRVIAGLAYAAAYEFFKSHNCIRLDDVKSETAYLLRKLLEENIGDYNTLTNVIRSTINDLMNEDLVRLYIALTNKYENAAVITENTEWNWSCVVFDVDEYDVLRAVEYYNIMLSAIQLAAILDNEEMLEYFDRCYHNYIHADRCLTKAREFISSMETS
ncbi:MAG: hypothetical protein QW212_01300 [Nitrososphaerales archaeon]